MADFWQGEIPTLQRLTEGSFATLEQRLVQEGRSVTLLLPCHSREIATVAFSGILDELMSATWLTRIVIGLDQADADDELKLQSMVTGFRAEVNILWLNGPGWQERLRKIPISLPPTGKGRNVWLSLGWILEQPEVDVIALHDCDIQPYEKELLIRLVAPVAISDFGMEFSKGYYARFTDRLHGRLTRLLFQPMLAALLEMIPDHAVLRRVQAFRYPLSGEIAMTAAVARKMRIVSGWGLETWMLAELHRLLPVEKTCQVDLCARYDHRHRPLEVTKAGQPGLKEPTEEVIRALMDVAGPGLDAPTLVAKFQQHATVALRRSRMVATMNGLNIDVEQEGKAVEIFHEMLQRILSNDCPNKAPVNLPSWEGLILENQSQHP